MTKTTKFGIWLNIAVTRSFNFCKAIMMFKSTHSMESYFRFKNTGPLNNDYYLILAMTIWFSCFRDKWYSFFAWQPLQSPFNNNGFIFCVIRGSKIHERRFQSPVTRQTNCNSFRILVLSSYKVMFQYGGLLLLMSYWYYVVNIIVTFLYRPRRH